MIDSDELNLYKDSAKDKIVDYEKQITKLKRKIEDLEEKNEHSLLSNISNSIKNQREKRLEKYNKKLNTLELKLETYKFDNIKQPEETPSTDTIAYFQYQNSIIDNDIKKIQIKKDTSVLTISKSVYTRSIKKLKKQQHKNDLKIKNIQRKIEDIQSKDLDEHIAEQKYKESKQNNKKFKENKSKIISESNDKQSESNDIDKQTVSNDKQTEVNDKQSESNDIDKQTVSNDKQSEINDKQSKVSDKQSESNDIDTVSDIDYSTLNPKNLNELSKLVSINTKIYKTLKKISDNQIDEQNIKIKASKIEQNNPILVSQKDEKPVKRKESLLSKLLNFAELLFGMDILSPKLLFKYMLKSVKESLKIFLKPFLTPIKLAIKGIYKLIKPLIKIVSKISKNVFSRGIKLGSEALASIREKLGIKTGEKTLAKTSENTLAKTSEKISVKSTSKFIKAAETAETTKSSSIFGWLEKKASSAVGFFKKKGLKFAEKFVLPYIEKLIGKRGLKILLKVLDDIPGVSILTGLGFGAYDIAKGNYAEAAVDVLSGIVGSIPWVGPILGIATSIAGNLIINKYKKSKIQHKINIKTKNNNQINNNLKAAKNSSYVFDSMVKDEINSFEQDPSILPEEIKYYNNKNNDNLPVVTINKNSYTDESGEQIKTNNIYKLRQAYAKYLVASSQGIDNKQYKQQIISFINNRGISNNIKTSDNNQQIANNIDTVSNTNTNTNTNNKSLNNVKNNEVPDLVFTNNQVKIGTEFFPSNPTIEQDYKNYKADKNTDNTEKILKDIKMLKKLPYKKDNSESKIKTLSSIFNNNQIIHNNTHTQSKEYLQNNKSTGHEKSNTDHNHINIINPPQKESARLIDMYQ